MPYTPQSGLPPAPASPSTAIPPIAAQPTPSLAPLPRPRPQASPSQRHPPSLPRATNRSPRRRLHANKRRQIPLPAACAKTAQPSAGALTTCAKPTRRKALSPKYPPDETSPAPCAKTPQSPAGEITPTASRPAARRFQRNSRSRWIRLRHPHIAKRTARTYMLGNTTPKRRRNPATGRPYLRYSVRKFICGLTPQGDMACLRMRQRLTEITPRPLHSDSGRTCPRLRAPRRRRRFLPRRQLSPPSDPAAHQVRPNRRRPVSQLRHNPRPPDRMLGQRRPRRPRRAPCGPRRRIRRNLYRLAQLLRPPPQRTRRLLENARLRHILLPEHRNSQGIRRR